MAGPGGLLGPAVSDRAKAIRDATDAHTNLNTYASIVTILEGGHLYGGHSTTAEKIIRLCKAEQGKQLRAYDRAVAKAVT